MSDESDKGVIRRVISYESDCLNAYEKFVASVENKAVRAIIMMLIEEKRAHIRELQLMLSEKETPGESATQASIPEYEEDNNFIC